jgi:hypothetical protein
MAGGKFSMGGEGELRSGIRDQRSGSKKITTEDTEKEESYQISATRYQDAKPAVHTTEVGGR